MKNLIRLLGRKKYETMRENVRNVSEHSSAEKQENTRLNSVNLEKITSLWIIYAIG